MLLTTKLLHKINTCERWNHPLVNIMVAITSYLTVIKYLFHRGYRICYLCCYYNPVPFSLICPTEWYSFHMCYQISKPTGATCWLAFAYLSEGPEIIPCYWLCSCGVVLIFYVVSCALLFVYFFICFAMKLWVYFLSIGWYVPQIYSAALSWYSGLVWLKL